MNGVMRLTVLCITLVIMTSKSTCVMVLDECADEDECPLNSRCTARSCAGTACICLSGFVPNSQLTSCVKAVDLDQECDGVNLLCRDKLAVCISGRCKCRPSYSPSLDNLKCKLQPAFGIRFALLGEPCDGINTVCQSKAQEVCDSDKNVCVCRDGLRPATPDELLSEPFRGLNCRETNFTLDVPGDREECIEPQLPVSAQIDEECFSYNNCPQFSDCVRRGCDGKVCVCIDGYHPANNGTQCKPEVGLGDSCSSDAVCSDEGRTTVCVNDTCMCKETFVATSGGRCKSRPDGRLEYALFGEVCGHYGDTRIICEDEWTTCNRVVDGHCVCQFGTREATTEEKARHPSNTNPCRVMDYELENTNPVYCERQKALVACQSWRKEELFWREFFKRRLTGTTGENDSDRGFNWRVEWKNHREKLRKCTELMPPSEEGDNWSDEVREMRIQ